MDFKWRSHNPDLSTLKKFFSTDTISEYWNKSLEIMYWISSVLFLSMNPTIFSKEGFPFISATAASLFLSFVYRFLSSNISSGCRIDSVTLELSLRNISESRIAYSATSEDGHVLPWGLFSHWDDGGQFSVLHIQKNEHLPTDHFFLEKTEKIDTKSKKTSFVSN